MRDFLGQPYNASAHGAAIDNMMYIIHIFMLVLFIGWSIFFIYTLFRFRAGKNPKGQHAEPKTKIHKQLEIVVILIEVILLVAFSIPLYAKRVAKSEFPKPSEAVTVRMLGEQFKWHFHYPGPDGVFGKSSVDLVDSQSNPLGLDRDSEGAADDVYSPIMYGVVDKPMLIQLTSRDVIHCLSLPNMRVKQDAMPGMMTPVWFTPILAGDYEIACAQLCGLGHSTMRGEFKVKTAEEYQTWLDEEVAKLSEEFDDF